MTIATTSLSRVYLCYLIYCALYVVLTYDDNIYRPTEHFTLYRAQVKIIVRGISYSDKCNYVFDDSKRRGPVAVLSRGSSGSQSEGGSGAAWFWFDVVFNTHYYRFRTKYLVGLVLYL